MNQKAGQGIYDRMKIEFKHKDNLIHVCIKQG